MTASPAAATVPSATKAASGGNALAALFAAAATSSMQRQNQVLIAPISSPSSARMIATANTAENSANDSDSAAKLIASLLNGANTSTQSPKDFGVAQQVTFIKTKTSNGSSTPVIMPEQVKLRNLESWQEENGSHLDESCYQELADSGNANGWSADDMFKYNEERHNILSSYNEKTLCYKYTTPLPKHKSKTTVRLAMQLAKEIEEKVLAEGRVTPESSDDDELFEKERKKKQQFRQQKQLDQLRTQLKTININYQNIHHQNQCMNHINPKVTTNQLFANGTQKSNKSSHHSNSSATPATASLSSSPTLNDSTSAGIRPVTSSSRNILRTCLT